MRPPVLRRLAAFSIVAFTTACSTDGPIDPSVLPDLPPAAGLDPDFSFFDQTPEAGGTVTAWELATARVAIAESEMAEVLAVPFAALSAAEEATPTRSGSVWRWPISFEVDEVPYDGELRSSAAGNQHGWDLILSAAAHEPPLDEFLWASGLSSAIGADGRWWIADADEGTNDVAAATSWALNAQDRVNLAFSATDSSVWSLERSASSSILTYTVYSLPRFRVTWSPQARTGSTWTSQTNLTQCWDEDLHNIAC